MFTTTNPSSTQISVVLSELPVKITEEMASYLEQPFTAEEIADALAQMCPTKAPGPDGFPAAFYQKHWSSVKEVVVKTCLHILNEGEVFSNLLKHAESQSLIHGLRFSRSLSITHLLFADDSLVFSKASPTECKKLKGIFDDYVAAFGQVFNNDKSSMFFSSNTNQSQVEEIKNIFGPNIVSKHEKYLGLPSMVGRKKISFFNEIKLRVLNKLSSWQTRRFSSGGKEVLIKAVAQAVSAFAISVFKIPQGLCNDIERAIARFWWGSSETQRSIHWARWEKLCSAKTSGGLGFREFPSFNQALIAKQGWRYTDFMEAKLRSNPSFVWRSILWGRQLLHEGLRWRVGNGHKISVFSRNWMKKGEFHNPTSIARLSNDVVVADFIDEKNQWKQEMVAQNFPKEITERILKIPLPKTPQEDVMIWSYHKHGAYSVKSGYQLAVKLKYPDTPGCSDATKSKWKVIWANVIPKKIKIFMWRAAHNLLPTIDNLWKKKVVMYSVCRICHSNREDVFHALVGCRAARKVWKLTEFYEDIKILAHQDMLSVLQELAGKRKKDDLGLIIATCWAIWYARNRMVNEGKQEDPQITAARAAATVESYLRIKCPNVQVVRSQHNNNQ
ncbi:putative reverse transcriptase/RNA-dependent DNA polymerase [Citrus sinensis]|uniref:Reverse transcriptase/RNA-dependent DNA polymerase n=1 Tax=Citrus sinensis TaxID=2711 RepID=A0ACB8MF99_CITSI|nr:putative reverse transcriptase/RNA-dependent DNA polymerase [Citrus sinensis]